MAAADQKKPVHPMVEVPDALGIVLETTARVIVEQQPKPPPPPIIIRIPVSQVVVGRHRLAQHVLMKEPGYPPYRASVMDGYAICTKDGIRKDGDYTHHVQGKVVAGKSLQEPKNHPEEATSSGDDDPAKMLLPPAVYVTTGARIPDGYDCVVPIEQITESSPEQQPPAFIRVHHQDATVHPQTWIRQVGCDISAGSVVLPKDLVITPVALGLLFQSGQSQVHVYDDDDEQSPIVVGVLSTGNELLVRSDDQWTTTTDHLITTGQIPDVNKPMLLSWLSTLQAHGNTAYKSIQAIDLGMARDDDIEGMTNILQDAIQKCNVILTTGGISMGETDIVKDVLLQRLGGVLHFGRLNMKPGKPTTFVTIPNHNHTTTLVFALPGNPVSAMVCTQLLVRPCLNLLLQQQHHQGSSEVLDIPTMLQQAYVPPEVWAHVTHDIVLDKGRPEYHRVTVSMSTTTTTRMGQYQYHATSTGQNQQSSRLASLLHAQGLLVLPKATADRPMVQAGDVVPVLLLHDNYHPLVPPVQVQHSIHWNNWNWVSSTSNNRDQTNPNNSGHPMTVAILHVVDPKMMRVPNNDQELLQQVQTALSGNRSGSVTVVATHRFDGAVNDLWDFFRQQQPTIQRIDVWVIACSGSFLHSLNLSEVVRKHVTKAAEALALQARRGAASQDGTAALFETVVGFVPQPDDHEGSIVIALPTHGLEGGLANVRGLLKHALNLGRGKAHNHHHNHHQDHGAAHHHHEHSH